MACDTQPVTPRQTLSERKTQVKAVIEGLSKALAAGRVKVVVGPQGAVGFQGWTTEEKAFVSDACAYRLLMVSGSALAKAAISRAEQMAGRGVDRKVVAQGVHMHGGHWHGKH